MEYTFRNIMKFMDYTLRESSSMTSRNKAMRLGLYDREGSLAVGKNA